MHVSSSQKELVEKFNAMCIQEQQPASSDDESKQIEALTQNIPFRKQVRQQMRMQGMRGGMRGMRPGSARRLQGPYGRMGGLHQGPLGGMGPRQARGPHGGRRNLE